MSRTIAAMCALTMLAIAGCDRVFVADPREPDLVGVYRLTSDSEGFLREQKGYGSIPVSVVELRPGSSISVRNLPDCAVDGFGRGSGAFVSGNGKWRLDKAFVGYGLTLDIAAGGTMKPGIYAGPWVAIRRRSSPHVLQISVGDPDSGESIRYERVSS